MEKRKKALPMVTVVIVNWNGKDIVSGALSGLREQTFRDFETIVVDNGSTDGSVDYIKKHYPEIITKELSCNTGFCVANNIALKSVETKYAALLNNDAVPDRDWLSKLVAALEANPTAGFAASKILFSNDPEFIDRAGDSYTIAGAGLLRGRGLQSHRFGRREFVFGACAAAALYKMEMLRETGFFDESFFLICEDVDLSFRAQLSGYRCVYEPDARVFHLASKTIDRDSFNSVYYGQRNVEWVYAKNMPSGLIPVTIFFHILYIAASFFYFALNGKARPFLKAKCDALKGFPEAWSARRIVQKSKRVGDSYLFGLFDKELLFPRLLARKRAKKSTGFEKSGWFATRRKRRISFRKVRQIIFP